MALTLTSKESGNFTPHPEGIHPMVCVDVIDLGLQETKFGPKEQVQFVFESEEKTPEGKRCTVRSRRFTQSLNPKASLAKFLAGWRGKPIAVGESIDLGGLVGKNCTVVVQHETTEEGKTFANISAISKPTKQLKPSGDYDPAETRRRIAEKAAKNGQPQRATPTVAADEDDGDLGPVKNNDDVGF